MGFACPGQQRKAPVVSKHGTDVYLYFYINRTRLGKQTVVTSVLVLRVNRLSSALLLSRPLFNGSFIADL